MEEQCRLAPQRSALSTCKKSETDDDTSTGTGAGACGGDKFNEVERQAAQATPTSRYCSTWSPSPASLVWQWALPLELIKHTLTFLSWPYDLHPLLVSKSLDPIARLILYCNTHDLPAWHTV